jgi:hypothetical protein
MSHRSQDKRPHALTASQQPRWGALLRPSAFFALQTVKETALRLLQSRNQSPYDHLSHDELVALVMERLTPDVLERMQRLAEIAPDQTIRYVPGMDCDSLSETQFYRMFLNEIEATHQREMRSGGQEG